MLQTFPVTVEAELRTRPVSPETHFSFDLQDLTLLPEKRTARGQTAVLPKSLDGVMCANTPLRIPVRPAATSPGD
jgi:hypothetical protein